MRKFLFGMMAMMGFFIMWSCSESAPTLVGEWQCDSLINEDDANLQMSVDMHLKADGTMDQAIKAVMDAEEDGMKIHFPYGISFAGTWTSDEKTLTLNVDSASVKVDFVADSMKISTDDPEKEALIAMLQTKMAKAFQEKLNEPDSDFRKGFNTESGVFEYELTNDALKLVEKKDSVENAVQVFKRKK